MRSFTMALLGLAVALPVGIATVPAHADSGENYNHARNGFQHWSDQNAPFGYAHQRRDENAQRYGWNEHNRYGENDHAYRGYNHEHERWRNGDQQFGYNGEHGWEHHHGWQHRYSPDRNYGYNGEHRGYDNGGYNGYRRDHD